MLACQAKQHTPHVKAQRLDRRRFLLRSSWLGGALLLAERLGLPFSVAGSEPPSTSPAGDWKRPDLISAPSDAAHWPAWREELAEWRAQTQQSLGYSDKLYRRPDFAWAQTNFACGFVMLCDERFYDAKRGCFTVDSFLDEGLREFGGYDSLVLWHAYPRIGFDERNQFDFYRDMPGGLAGLRKVSQVCHARGVKVFLDYNPWDTGIRREQVADPEALAALVKAINADGIFLDTMNRGAAEFRAALDAVRPGVVLESEGALPLECIHDHHCSWAQWFQDSLAPGVLRNKWFERRHLQHQIKRWDCDHAGELHCAWMNGSGMMVWENVFGSWVGWSARDRAILRTMLPIQRRYAALFCGEGWTPLVPTEGRRVYASLWTGDGLRLWTLINRSEKAVEGALLKVRHELGARYFDLVQGREATAAARDAEVLLSGAILPRGVGAFLAGSDAVVKEDFPRFLESQAQLQARVAWSTEFPSRPTRLVPVTPTRRRRSAALAPGMVAIPAAEFVMKTEFRVRECGFYESLPGTSLTPVGLHRPLILERSVKLAPYAIDLTPVTNAQFAEFIKASGYQPKHSENFLRHWQNGAPPPGREEHPVVCVSLEDARAYAAWADKRLPTEEEWQHAAQGREARLYPWGNELRPGVCNDGSSASTMPVTAFPAGRSPFGCYDMCGNVWHWTESERSDGRTRFCILKGGAFYKARGSDWYADGGPLPCRFAAKFLLMWPGLDRCSTIGFRCAVDLT